MCPGGGQWYSNALPNQGRSSRNCQELSWEKGAREGQICIQHLENGECSGVCVHDLSCMWAQLCYCIWVVFEHSCAEVREDSHSSLPKLNKGIGSLNNERPRFPGWHNAHTLIGSRPPLLAWMESHLKTFIFREGCNCHPFFTIAVSGGMTLRVARL